MEEKNKIIRWFLYIMIGVFLVMLVVWAYTNYVFDTRSVDIGVKSLSTIDEERKSEILSIIKKNILSGEDRSKIISAIGGSKIDSFHFTKEEIDQIVAALNK